MVKKRQADLDIGTLSIKPQKIVSSLRDRDKVNKQQKKKATAPRSFNQFTLAAKDLLFGKRKSSDVSKREDSSSGTQNASVNKPNLPPDDCLFSLGAASVKVNRLSHNPRQLKGTEKSRKDIAPDPLTPSRNSKPATTPVRKRTRSSSLPVDESASPLETNKLSTDRHKEISNSRKVKSSRKGKSSAAFPSNSNSSLNENSSSQPQSNGGKTPPSSSRSPNGGKTPSSSSRSPFAKSAKYAQSVNSPKFSGPLAEANKKSTGHTRIQSSLRDLANQTTVRFDEGGVSDTLPEGMAEPENHSQMVWELSGRSWLVAFSSRVEIRGMARVTSLASPATVQIHGYLLGYGESVNVYSPVGYHNGIVEKVNYSEEEAGRSQQSVFASLNNVQAVVPSVNILQYTKVRNYCSENPGCMVIYLTELDTPHLQACVDLLPSTKIPYGYTQLAPRLLLSDYAVPPQYSETTLNAVKYLVNQHREGQRLRIVVCGAKNLGKSTLIRYIINRLLSAGCNQVRHLECDPGQCEFSPPGCLTLNTVSEPLLGPPWCRVSYAVDHTQLYGAISADVDPDTYVSCVRNLVEKCNRENASEPLVVSTMGWKQGLGLQFLSATIAELNPTHLIQLCTDSPSYKNFPEFSVLSLISHSMFLSPQRLSRLRKELNYELMPLSMPHCDNLEYESDVLRPILSRDLMTTAYMFQSSLPDQRIINDITPYRVDMASVALSLGLDSLPTHLICAAINTQMVVLCKVSLESLTSSTDSDFLALTGSAPESLDVIGYGFIRGIDMDMKCLYVTTPLPQLLLSDVNVLYKIHGSITPDMWFFSQIAKVRDDHGLPYLSMRKSGAGFVSTADAKYKYRKGRNRKSAEPRGD